jgi:hypothetical protein
MAIDERALKCESLGELVADYVEGALSADDRQRFEHPSAPGDACIAYLKEML